MITMNRLPGLGHRLPPRTLGLLALALCAALPWAAFAAPWGSLVSEDGSQRIELEGDEVVIGSAENVGARIQHETVSPRHAVLRHKDGVVTISDLNSRYHTLFAGTELRKNEKKRIVQRTLLTFGAVTWAFEWGERSTIPPTQERADKAGKDAKVGKAGRSGKGSKR